MKSSESVFTRQNPFASSARGGKTHYNPSGSQALSKRKKNATLSPVRTNQKSRHPLEKHRGSAAEDGELVFAESWPSTECGLSPASTTNTSNVETFRQSAREGKPTEGVQQDSVMAKYIERFRHGRPQSRVERQQKAPAIGENELPLWWKSPSSSPLNSTPRKTTGKGDHGSTVFSPSGQCQLDRSLSPGGGSLSVLSETYHEESEDAEILNLQERANRLLLRDDCTLGDGSMHVSSEGLGSSDFTSPFSVEEPVRRPLIPSIIKSTVLTGSDSVQAFSSSKACTIPSLVPPTRPEEDILFQWRLRRKMEQAREGPHNALQHQSLHGPSFSWHTPSLSQASASGQPYKQQSNHTHEFPQKAAHPHITAPQPETKEEHRFISQSQATGHVPAHMHLLCDVLPCPIQSSHAHVQQNFPKVSPSVNQSKDKAAQTVPENLMNATIEGEKRVIQSERWEKEGAQTKKPGENEKKVAMSSRKQRKSTRYTGNDPDSSKSSSSHQRAPKKVMQCAEKPHQQGRQELSHERFTDHHAPPPSPIHCALGQVVSEVLFPAGDSPAQKTPVLSVSPADTACVQPQSSALPGNAKTSMEVISQLLQEAEDSDEKEFEDDPLLQVLRKQRKWVKEQLSEVDLMLDQLPDEQQVTRTEPRRM